MKIFKFVKNTIKIAITSALLLVGLFVLTAKASQPSSTSYYIPNFETSITAVK